MRCLRGAWDSPSPQPSPGGRGSPSLLQCKRPCSAARAKRALRGGFGLVSSEFRDLGSPAPFFVFVSCQCQLFFVIRHSSFVGGAAFTLHGFVCLLLADQGPRFYAEQ